MRMLKRKVVTPVEMLVTISEEPLKQLSPSVRQSSFGRAKRSGFWEKRK